MSRYYNIITFGKKSDNLLLSIEKNVIGTFLRTAPDYIFREATIFLHCHSLIWGQATVASEYFFDEQKIWSDKIYPHRFKIKEVKLTSNPLNLVDSGYNNKLRKDYGTSWAYSFIFAPKPLPFEIGQEIEAELSPKLIASFSEFAESIKKLETRKTKIR